MRPFSSVILFFLVAVVVASLPGAAWAQSSFPKPAGSVNDFADVLTPPYEARIGALAKELLAKTGVTLVLVTLRDLGGADATEYANGLYNAWGLGKTAEDRGLLVLVSVREQKMRIRTGAGLKEVLTPPRVAEIQDRFVAPLLKQNNYDDGLVNGVVALGKIIGKEAGVPLVGDAAPKGTPKASSSFPIALALLGPLAAVLAFLVYRIIRRRKAGAERTSNLF